MGLGSFHPTLLARQTGTHAQTHHLSWCPIVPSMVIGAEGSRSQRDHEAADDLSACSSGGGPHAPRRRRFVLERFDVDVPALEARNTAGIRSDFANGPRRKTWKEAQTWTTAGFDVATGDLIDGSQHERRGEHVSHQQDR